MKKLKYLILLLLLVPITVFAKTPNKDETIKVIESIENVQVDEGIVIYNVSIDDIRLSLNINDNGTITTKDINYSFNEERLSFDGGTYMYDPTTNKLEVIENNDYSFYLYSILENKSSVPYNVDSYYNNKNIEEKIMNLQEDEKIYKDDSNTFGITLKRRKINDNKYQINISYQYYFTGDYPVMIKEETTDEFTNPDTGNYTIIVSIILVFVLGMGIYTCIPNKRIKGE